MANEVLSTHSGNIGTSAKIHFEAGKFTEFCAAIS